MVSYPLPNNPPPDPDSGNGIFTLIGSPANCVSSPGQLSWTFESYMEVTPICPNTLTKCYSSTATLNGVSECSYYYDFDFCSATCNTITITWYSLARNYTITSGAANQGIYTGNTTIDLNQSCNSSPQFSTPPVPYICLNQTYTFNQGATDPDGDSLSYALISCYDSQNTPVTYNTGYSSTAPLGANCTVTLDPVTGDITILPTTIEIGVMCVEVTEWRNGVPIGTVVRDMQITVISCSNNLPEVSGIDNTTIYIDSVCIGQQISFLIFGTDADSASQNNIMYWNQGIPGGVFSNTSSTVFDTLNGVNPVALFTWTPTIANVGVNQFLVTITDDNCPLLGVNQFTFQIIVLPGLPLLVTGDNQICVGASTTLTASNGNQYFWSNGDTGPVISVSPTVTTTYTVNDTTTTSGCGSTPASITVNVTQLPVCTVTGNDSICLGDQTTLTVNAPGAVAYLWQPGNIVGNSITVSPTQTTVYTVFGVTLDSCVGPVTSYPVTVTPGPNVSITGNLFLCNGQSTTLTAATAQSYLWSTGQTTPSITITPTGDTTISCVGATNSCVGQPATVNISVFPTPTSPFSISPLTMCEGGQSTVTFTGTAGAGATFDWDFSGGTIISGSGSGPYVISWANAGTKNVTLSITENGCTSPLTTVQVTVNPIPTASAGSAVGTCSGQGVALSGQGLGAGPSYSYSWSPSTYLSNPNVANPIATPPASTSYCLTVTSNGCTSLPSCVNVTINDNPVVDAGPDMFFCDGTGGIQINGTATGGVSPYIYVWAPNDGSLTDPNIEDPIANPDSATTYYFYVIGANGCMSNIDSMVVTPADLPIVDVGADVWRCQDGPGNFITATVLNPVGGYSVQWSPSAGLYCDSCLTTYATPDTTTIYCAVVTSLLTGCTSDPTNLNTNSCLTYTVRPMPVADAGPDIEICEGSSVQTCGIATSAGPQYTFEWSPNFGMNDSTLVCPTFSPPFTTIYTLVVTSNGCPSYADSVVVTVRPTLTADAGQVRTICAGDSVQLDGQYNGAWAPTGFVWYPSIGLSDSTAQTPMASPASTTWYYFTVFNGLCPSDTDSVQVIVNPKPIANAGPDLQLCPEGDSIAISMATATAGLPPYTYLWQPSSGLQDANLLNPNIKPDTTTLYTLTVITGTAPNVCTDTDTMWVIVKPGLDISVAVDTNTVCQGQLAQITSSGGSGSAVFTWSPSIGLVNPNDANTWAYPDTTVTYVLTVTEHGCTGYDSIHIRVLDTPDAAFTASSTQSCGELSVAFLNLSADGSAYEWNFGDGDISNQTSPLHTYTQPGIYTVTLVALSPGGCADTIIQTNMVSLSDPGMADFRSTPEPPVEVSLPNSSTISFYDQSELAVSWTWDFGDGVSSTDRNPNHTFVNPGVYYVTLTTKTADGCESTLRKGPYTVFTPELFVPNIFTPNNDGMNDGFLTNYGGDEAFLLQIFDRWGTKYFQTTNKNEAWQGTNLNGSKATDGVYFYTLRIGDRNYSGNVTLMR